jgi:hypothetical protein
MRQGLRASLLPAINLAQISEFSLVLLQVGLQSGQATPKVANAISLAFVILAVLSTFMMMRSDQLTRAAIPALKRIGFNDLDARRSDADEETANEHRILILGFYRLASSLVSEIERRRPALLEQVCVVDFNPNVYHTLRERNVTIHYGDIAHADTLSHAGAAEAEIVISTVPDSLLKGTTNEKLVRHVRMLNPSAKIIATAEVLANVQLLYAAGADYVIVSRLAAAGELIEAVTAAEAGLLGDMKVRLDALLADRQEILP